MTAPYLQIQGLRMEFGQVVAVHDVTLDIRQGEFREEVAYAMAREMLQAPDRPTAWWP